MTKSQKKLHESKLIINLNHRLFLIEMRIMQGKPSDKELQGLEQNRLRIETRLMGLYGTEKYGLN